MAWLADSGSKGQVSLTPGNAPPERAHDAADANRVHAHTIPLGGSLPIT
jgi:hypothetical protein